jgi:hypothetical protein
MRVRSGTIRLPAAFAAAVLLACPPPAAAEEPTEAVKAFYDHPGLELDPAARDRFVDPARTVLDQNDALKASGNPQGCLDPNLAFDDAEFDPEVVRKTLKLAQSVDGDEAKVIAAFKVASGVARLEWKLRNVGGQWKVADVISMSNDWALSQFGCQ